jgi:hypothetical protein
LVEQACDVLPRDPIVHGNVHALVAEVIGQLAILFWQRIF